LKKSFGSDGLTWRAFYEKVWKNNKCRLKSSC
jgi:hypothetical protein